jgi:hypothetical protein
MMMKKPGHERIDLSKVDIERAEHARLDGPGDVTNLPTRMRVDFHHRFPGICKERTASSIERLRKLGCRIFAISKTGREIGCVLDTST